MAGDVALRGGEVEEARVDEVRSANEGCTGIEVRGRAGVSVLRGDWAMVWSWSREAFCRFCRARRKFSTVLERGIDDVSVAVAVVVLGIVVFGRIIGVLEEGPLCCCLPSILLFDLFFLLKLKNPILNHLPTTMFIMYPVQKHHSSVRIYISHGSDLKPSRTRLRLGNHGTSATPVDQSKVAILCTYSLLSKHQRSSLSLSRLFYMMFE